MIEPRTESAIKRESRQLEAHFEEGRRIKRKRQRLSFAPN